MTRRLWMLPVAAAVGIVILKTCFHAPDVEAASRSKAARAEFQRANPCPANGQRRGPCPGFTVDHRVGLCVGGADSAQNMRWMTAAAAKAKDRWECLPGWQDRLRECEAAGCFVAP